MEALPRDAPLLALVPPPRVARFRRAAGLAPDEPVAGDFSGWSKLVLLGADRAILFPRGRGMAGALEREVEALEAVAPAALPEVPRVLGRFDDPALHELPFVVLSRVRGERLAERLDDPGLLRAVFASLGERAAAWHALDPAPLAARTPRGRERDDWLGRALGPGGEPAAALEEAAAALAPPAEEGRLWEEALAAAAKLAPVIVHGDLHEEQLLFDPERRRVSGILDWQTASVDHPFREVALVEWGSALWLRRRAEHPALRAAFWSAYAAARGLDPRTGALLEWAWSLDRAMASLRAAREGDARRLERLGPPEEARAALDAATRALAGS